MSKELTKRIEEILNGNKSPKSRNVRRRLREDDEMGPEVSADDVAPEGEEVATIEVSEGSLAYYVAGVEDMLGDEDKEDIKSYIASKVEAIEAAEGGEPAPDEGDEPAPEEEVA